MLTGLLGNALGWDWTERDAHQSLQDRIILAAALVSEGEMLTDVQNVQLRATDRSWTTRGRSEGRAGASYSAPHRRHRDFLTDAEVVVVLTLMPEEPSPTLDGIRAALMRPARPLFLGRKSCLPSAPLLGFSDGMDIIEATDAYAALHRAVGAEGTCACWPEGEGPGGMRTLDLADLRNWDSGLHGGTRQVHEGRL